MSLWDYKKMDALPEFAQKAKEATCSVCGEPIGNRTWMYLTLEKVYYHTDTCGSGEGHKDMRGR